jgi:hypothetical protein
MPLRASGFDVTYERRDRSRATAIPMRPSPSNVGRPVLRASRCAAVGGLEEAAASRSADAVLPEALPRFPDRDYNVSGRRGEGHVDRAGVPVQVETF